MDILYSFMGFQPVVWFVLSVIGLWGGSVLCFVQDQRRESFPAVLWNHNVLIEIFSSIPSQKSWLREEWRYMC